MTTDAASSVSSSRPRLYPERALGAFTAAVILWVRLTSNFPLGFGFFTGPLIDAYVVAAICSSALLIFRPWWREGMAAAAAMSTIYWTARAANFLYLSLTIPNPETSVATAFAVYSLLAAFVGTFWARSLRRISFYASLRNLEPRDHG